MAESPGLCRFLLLPLELRNSIYAYLLSTEYTREDKIERTSASNKSRHSKLVLIQHGRFPMANTSDITTSQLTPTTFNQPYSAAIIKSTRKPRESSTIRTFSSLSRIITASRDLQISNIAASLNTTAKKKDCLSLHVVKARGLSSTTLWRST